MALSKFAQLGLNLVASLTGGTVVDVPDSPAETGPPVLHESGKALANPASIIASVTSPGLPLISAVQPQNLGKAMALADADFNETLEAATGKFDKFLAAMDKVQAKQGNRANTPDGVRDAVISAAAALDLTSADVEIGFGALIESCKTRRRDFNASQATKTAEEVERPRSSLTATQERLAQIKQQVFDLEAERVRLEAGILPTEEAAQKAAATIAQAESLFTEAEQEVLRRLESFKQQVLAACS